MRESDQAVRYIDNPVSTEEEDRFGFCRYRDALIRVVRSSDTPLTVGIFGPWGSGKTSLMKLVQEDLPRQAGQGHWRALPVWFNAWQYDRDEALWRALILTVLDGLRLDAPPDQTEALDRVEESLYRSVEWEDLGKWTIDWARALEGTARGATQLALALIPGAVPLAGIIEQLWSLLRGESATDDQIRQATQAVRREAQKYRREQLRSLEQFQRDFARLVRERALDHNKRLVVFIDDLDRCLPEKAIEVLETLKLFLSAEGCFFFVAADRDVIEQGIRVKYQSFLVSSAEGLSEADVARRIPITGRDYIEKIVQLPFSLPLLERPGVRSFIEQAYPDLSACAPICAAGLEPNPRKVKRTLNLLRLLLGLAPDTIDLALLAKVVIIQNRYPDLYAHLFDYPLLLQELERYFIQRGHVSSPPPESDLQKQTLYKLRDTYIHHKALQDMLWLPPLFDDLSREQVERYLYLTRATSEDKRVAAIEIAATSAWDNLRSGDLTQVSEAIRRIQASGQSDPYATQIAALLEQSDLPPRERLSLGLAWGLLGCPRDLDEWVAVPGAPFMLGKYPVTNQQYRRFIEAGGYETQAYWDASGWEHAHNVGHPRYWDSGLWNQPTQPVVGVSWYEARAYCRWLSEQQGQTCRLPSEDDWVRAAVASSGPVDTAMSAYPWGAEFGVGRANTRDSGLGVTTPAGCYPLGASVSSGAHDMSGNVWEWMSNDGYRPGSKALRGGSWHESADQARVDARLEALPTYQTSFVGVRVLCETFTLDGSHSAMR